MLRTKWHQNEIDYLRECRRKVDATAFIKLNTICHGIHLLITSQIVYFAHFHRYLWGCIVSERTCDNAPVCDETGVAYGLVSFEMFIPHLMNSYARRICYENGKKVMSALNAIFSNLRLGFLLLVERSGSSNCTTASRTVIICIWPVALSPPRNLPNRSSSRATNFILISFCTVIDTRVHGR